MLDAVLRLSGLARAFGSLKLRLEDKAGDAVARVKGIAMRIAIAAGLAIAALIFIVLALMTGLVALYAYLQPIYGSMTALGMVGGLLVVTALLLAIAAMLVGRSKSRRSSAADDSDEVEEFEDDDWETDSRNGRHAPGYALSRRESQAASEITDSIVSFASAAGRSQRRVQDDDSLDAITLLQSGDRRTMMAVLGAVAAIGWLLGRNMPHSLSR